MPWTDEDAAVLERIANHTGDLQQIRQRFDMLEESTRTMAAALDNISLTLARMIHVLQCK